MSAGARPRPRSILQAVLLAVAAVLLAVPASATASTIALRLDGQATAGRPFNVIAEGVAQNNADFYTSNLTARIKRVDLGLPCGLDLQTDAGSIVMIGYAVANGPYAVPLPITVDEPGQWLLCVWFDSVSADSHRHDSLVVDVRGPKNGLTVSAPSVVRKGRPAVVKLRGSAELPRLLLTKLVRGRTSCGQAYASELESPSLTAVRPVRDAIRLDVRTRMLKRPGVYTICAYVQEQIDEPRAELVARRLVRVR
jgi:hypothetical protein